MYWHIDPRNRKIVYIGHGTNERAWRCTSYKNGEEANYGHRSKEHADWCQELIQLGFLPDDWVEIVERRLDKSAACQEEQRLIRHYKPRFNKPQGKALLKITGALLDTAKQLRQHMSYFDIGKELGVSTMTVWRVLNGKNKNG